MTSKAIANPLLRHVSKRYASAQAALIEPQLHHSKLPNNTFVAALDNGSPVTRVTVAFAAGSRYEQPTLTGAAHMLRAAAGLSTKSSSGFIIARKLAQAGATVSTSGDREIVYYTLETTQNTINESLECLCDMVSGQDFRPWELSEILPRLKYDIAALPPQVRAVDLLHKAAFRRGLGNSLFISPKRIGNISSECMQHYAVTTISPARCAIVVSGDTQDKAELIARALNLPQSDAAPYEQPTKYYGGELRKEMGGDLAHIALAFSGAKVGTTDAIALAIASKALGSGPSCKWGSDNTPLGRALGNIGPFAAAGFNVSYSDGGLFGAVLTVPKDEAAMALKALATVLRNPQLDARAIQAGRKQLKLQLLSEAESGALYTESIAAQGLYTGGARSPKALAEAVDHVSDSEVCSVLSTIMKTRLSMGAAGNLTCTPYVDEL